MIWSQNYLEVVFILDLTFEFIYYINCRASHSYRESHSYRANPLIFHQPNPDWMFPLITEHRRMKIATPSKFNNMHFGFIFFSGLKFQQSNYKFTRNSCHLQQVRFCQCWIKWVEWINSLIFFIVGLSGGTE